MSHDLRTIRVHRRGRDEAVADYEIPFRDGMTVLDALEYIRAHLDPTLLYRHSCHHGSCGTCGMVIDNERKLACLSRLPEQADTPIELHALPAMRPIADLAVDPTPLFDHFPSAASYLRPSEINRGSTPPQEVAAFERFENCIECGLCVAACPVIGAKQFKGPAALAAYSRAIARNPEREKELLAEVDGADGAPGCDRHLNCSAVCPTGVYPAKEIVVLRKRIEKRDAAADATADGRRP